MESYVAPKAHGNASAASALDTRSVTADTRPGESRVVATTSPLRALTRGKSLTSVVAGETTRLTTGAVLSRKKRKRLFAKQAPELVRKSPATGQPAAPKAQRAGPSAEQMDLGEEWNHVVRGVCCQVHHYSTRTPNPPQPATEVPKQPKVTATRKTERPKNLKPNLQQSLSRLLGSPRKSSHECQNHGCQTHKPRSGGPHPKFHLPTRGNFLSRSPSSPSMCGADSSAPHIHLLPSHRGSSPAGCPEDRYSLRGRIWQHALGGLNGVKPCASPAGMRTVCAVGSLNWSTFSATTVSIFVS